MKKDLILVGGGGHCHAIIDVIKTTNQFRIVGIVDKPEMLNNDVLGYKVIGNDKDIPALALRYQNFLITVGQIKNAKTRVSLYQKILESGGDLPTIISPHSYVANNVTIGKGTVVMHHALVNTNVKIGVNNIINTRAIVEHDSTVGDHNHISTNAVLNGGCTISNSTFIGSGSVVNHGISITSEVVLSSMSLVHRNIEKTGIYAGTPAKRIK